MILNHGMSIEQSVKDVIEKSSVYLGYKILWCLSLFLNGKKFPQGNMKEKRWRQYVSDIVEYITNESIL